MEKTGGARRWNTHRVLRALKMHKPEEYSKVLGY
jgi:hypothetical protein